MKGKPTTLREKSRHMKVQAATPNPYARNNTILQPIVRADSRKSPDPKQAILPLNTDQQIYKSAVQPIKLTSAHRYQRTMMHKKAEVSDAVNLKKHSLA